MDELNYQQQIVFEQRERALKSVWSACDKLEAKATALLASSSVVVGLVTGAHFLPTAWSGSMVVPDLLLVGVLLAFLFMLWFALRLWQPQTFCVPGPQNLDELYDEYISQSADDAYNNVLIDLVHSIDTVLEINSHKANMLRWMVHSFAAQVLLLIAAVLWPAAKMLIR